MRISSFYFTTLFAIFCLNTSQAEEEPDFDATFAFLEKKLNVINTNRGNGYIHKKSQIISSNKESCLFTITTKYSGHNDFGSENINYMTKYILDLSISDPEKISYGNSITILSKENLNKIKFIEDIRENDSKFNALRSGEYSCSKTSCLKKENIDNADLTVLSPSKDNAPRVIRALRNLIKLCGGKGELF